MAPCCLPISPEWSPSRPGSHHLCQAHHSGHHSTCYFHVGSVHLCGRICALRPRAKSQVLDSRLSLNLRRALPFTWLSHDALSSPNSNSGQASPPSLAQPAFYPHLCHSLHFIRPCAVFICMRPSPLIRGFPLRSFSYLQSTLV